MTRPLSARTALLAAVVAAACRSAGGAGPAPEPTPAVTPAPASASAPAARPAASPAAADVAFMRAMIGHHAQALAMTALVPERAARPELRPLAERIETTQRDEIALMRRWLERRGVAAEEHAAHGTHVGHAMPGDSSRAMRGMLTDAELQRLAAARGAAFDRLFLESMIRHHEGALAMVADYFRTPGAGQESEAYRLASDVDADQRAEIRRMRTLLEPTTTSRP
jgi:uncharacterized protein (DUF305 family)